MNDYSLVLHWRPGNHGPRARQPPSARLLRRRHVGAQLHRHPCIAGALSAAVPGGAAIRLDRRAHRAPGAQRSEEHTSELQSLMSISYAVFCLKENTIQKLTS